MLKLVSCGIWSDGDTIAVGNELLIFFAKAQPPKANTIGKETTMWVYDDAYVHVLRRDAKTRRVGTHVLLAQA